MSVSKSLYFCGVSYQNVSTEILGKCSVAKENCAEREKLLLEKYGVSEVVLLSTCNRVEYYFIAPENFDVSALVEEIFPDAKDVCLVKKDVEAITHLFEVASGLKSQMTGETEIFGQVKTAYSTSFERGHCSAVLNAIFQKTAQVGKWIRTNTDIGKGQISIGSVSAELASQIFEDIKRAKILLVGSGEAGRLIAEALFVRNARKITIASRSRENAEKLATQIGVASADMADVLEGLSEYDIVICASAAGLIIDKSLASKTIKKRRSPMFVIDLSMPKNVEESCGKLDGLFLYDMNNLSEIASTNMDLRKGEIQRAHNIINEKAIAFFKKISVRL